MRLQSRAWPARRAFTFIETLMVVATFTLIIGLFSWVTVDSTRLGKETTSDATMSASGRLRLDTFINDVRDSSSALARWTDPSTGTTYISHLTTDSNSPPSYYATLILEAPAFDASHSIPTTQQSNGTLRPTYYDHIVYRLEPVSGTSPSLYTLNRLVVTDSHSARPASLDTIMARNVSSASFTCLVDQAFDGTGTQAVFSLKAPVSANGGDSVASVTVGGVTQTQPTNVQYVAPTLTYPDGTIQFTTAPAAGAHVDTLYSVDSTSANQQLVTGVSLNLMLAVTDPSLPTAARQQTLELSGRANLHNH